MTSAESRLLVRVNLGDRSYDIAIGSGMSGELEESLSR